ncbi:NAD(P)-dependent oxidoreductase [Sphingomonas sp. Leaf67]|uniref:SDR family oxidoreductase n=1 Tax=Sphingomonas sp. Leaf67 TaxID=1736230 RepID=UPI0006F8B87F|nr:SDR family oxidoreductase [Sphingomonas sp. Leaf67]KQN90832.1 NAD(P)-dependent oxidoreductase [Sphingomonas sp. Leaf67]
MNRLQGKYAFVSGAAQGIGRSITEAFIKEGARVIAADLQWRNRFSIDTIEEIDLDLTDEAAVGRVISDRPLIDVLVNCVGWVASGSLLDCTTNELTRSFDINVLSMAHTMRAALPGMLARERGSIVNIASVVSSTKGVPDRFAYATTKAAVIGLTKSVARDFIGKGVRCNSISPGSTFTPSLEDRFAASGDAAAARAAFIARQPMGRLGDPAEIAQVAVMLASDEARFITGADVIVDGGMSL